MRILAVDTATSWQSVALKDGDRLLALVEQDAAGSHTRWLMPAIDRALKKAGVELRDLTGLAISIGPGSFTGLRVGLATMLGFRSVLGIPLVLVPTLEAMAWQYKNRLGTLVPVLKSRKNEVFWSFYEWLPGGALKVLTHEQVGSPEMLGRAVREVLPATLCGDGWLTYRDEIQRALGPAAKDVDEGELHRPSALSVWQASLSRFGKRDVAGPRVAPLYVQRPEAEVKYDENQGMSPLERRKKRIALKLDRSAQQRRKKAAGPMRKLGS